jgi:hypothetical protein
VIKRWASILCLYFLVACRARPTALSDLRDVLPAPDAIPGWHGNGASATYDRGSLSDWLEDKGDLYLSYGFQALIVGQYANASGHIVQVEVYRLSTDADAYGLFALNSYGAPLDLGIDGELDEGYRLAFWQSRTFVQIVAQSQLDDHTLTAFGQAVSSALPEGGQRPSLVEVLPTEGLGPGRARFFRAKMAPGNIFWVSTEDVLGLDEDTEGVLAHYEIDGRRMDLLLIAFPGAARAQAAQSGLKRAGIKDLLTTDVQDRTLGAVFGLLDEDKATKPGCDCAPDEIPLASDRLPEDIARELLDRAMAALP